jgi:hypothetical protein
MNKLQRKLVSAGAATALLLNTITPVFAETTLEISGNTNDDNNVSLNQSNTTSVSQNNTASVTNIITATADTGNNTASRNAGGETSIETGDADVDVEVTNDLNHNVADVDRCNGCGVGDVTVAVTGNTNDDNTADVVVDNTTVVSQNNAANIYNDVWTGTNTGGNKTSRNAGGDTSVSTGDASTETTIHNMANSNALQMGGENGDGELSVLIAGNTNDDNTVELGAHASTWVVQNNYAAVDNIVASTSNTGDNNGSRNASGDVTIETGDAETDVHVVNALNNNSAFVMGGGDSSVAARITGNANDDDNTIDLDLAMNTTLFQSNTADVLNLVYADAATGDNSAKHNAGGEVEIETGDATVHVDLETSTNFNFADVECDCLFDDVLAKIAGNTNDDNTISGNLSDGLYVNQGNCGYYYGQGVQELGWFYDPYCQTTNVVTADGMTGDNAVKSNASGYADPSVETGDVDMHIDATTSGNANIYGETPDMDFGFPQDHDMSFSFTFDMEFWNAFMSWWNTNQA